MVESACYAAGESVNFFSMATDYQELDGLYARVDDVVYMPALEAPSNKPHPFVYFITIQNDTDERVQVQGRKWVVREKGGEVTVVEGEGVVGQNPVLEAGEHFAYNSYHVTARDAQVMGTFFGMTATGEKVRISIPPFLLDIPDWA